MTSNVQHTGYIFTPTQDWVSHNIEGWRKLFPLVGPNPRVLEIGSWEGRSAVFYLTELCDSIVCIDHFDLWGTTAGRERYKKLTHNLELTKKKYTQKECRVMDEFSIPALMKLLEEETMNEKPGYDWIYIDGSHEASDTFLDGELAWRLAKKGAIVIFDDYHWDAEPESSMHHPKRGIDAFLLLHNGEFELLSDTSNYQVLLKKTTDMRIGFLVKPEGPSEQPITEELGYGMNLAVAADSGFAMAATVAIRSAVEATCMANERIRMSIYILDCGLSVDDKRMMRDSVPVLEDLTLIFIDLPESSLTKKMGAVWAKVDMIRALPVQRVLYLDADVLVLENLKDLWRTDLEGKPLGAVRDVGFPNGHGDIKGPYFNAGVILLDLALARMKFAELETLSVKTLRFLDQDALNIHFHGEFFPISQEWNAQGLGTYADLPSVDREDIKNQLVVMKRHPRIVHFTGPVHPTMAEVLNPFVKYSAKPWGYASSMNHPYCQAWWLCVERTAWVGIQKSEAYTTSCKAEYEKAVNAARDEFKQVLEKTEGMRSG
ncbi:nucleotide-diphospho-sugar transferase [Mycena crocata]|nr:nucleotide-diphospho-sugar transferase [Mycena crocata]